MLCCNAVRYDVHVRTYSGKLLLHCSRSARWLLRLSMRHLVSGTSHLNHHHYLPTYLSLLSPPLCIPLFFSFLLFSSLLFGSIFLFFTLFCSYLLLFDLIFTFSILHLYFVPIKSFSFQLASVLSLLIIIFLISF